MCGPPKSRILLVEDEAMISMLIEDMVQEFGCEIVSCATKLDDALALARDAQVDIAVLDINLAGVLTYPVADVLHRRGIPIIFATGYGAGALPERFRDTPTLEKPFNQEDLQRVVQAILTAPAGQRGWSDQPDRTAMRHQAPP